MAIVFNVDEVLEMGEQIERNGAAFYRKAAQATPDDGARDMLLRLARMEDDHEKTFSAMRRELTEEEKRPTVYDPDGEAAQYLRAMASGYVFDVKGDPAASLTGAETLDEILRRGIKAEKDSIVFYLGLKDIVPKRLGKDSVDDIIKEEMAHITLLSSEMASLGK